MATDRLFSQDSSAVGLRCQKIISKEEYAHAAIILTRCDAKWIQKGSPLFHNKARNRRGFEVPENFPATFEIPERSVRMHFSNLGSYRFWLSTIGGILPSADRPRSVPKTLLANQFILRRNLLNAETLLSAAHACSALLKVTALRIRRQAMPNAGSR